MEKKILVEGMMCNHCKATVEKALGSLDGVQGCTVDLEAKTATVTMEREIDDGTLMETVRAKGFNPVRVL